MCSRIIRLSACNTHFPVSFCVHSVSYTDVSSEKNRVVETEEWTVPKPLVSLTLVHSLMKSVAGNKRGKARDKWPSSQSSVPLYIISGRHTYATRGDLTRALSLGEMLVSDCNLIGVNVMTLVLII